VGTGPEDATGDEQALAGDGGSAPPGATGRAPARATRIVSLCPSLTETLIDLGLAPALVGVTRFCIHPAEVVAGLEKVGGTKDPDVARIAALAPDLVLMNEEENRREDFEALSARCRVVTSLPRRIADVPDELLRLGALTGTADRAGDRARELREALDALDALPPRPFRHAYLIWRRPWMAVGGDTYVSDLLARAGGVNVLADLPARYPEVDLADLAARRPEVVLLPDEPYPFSEKHLPELAAALPGVRLELVGGDDCCWHGVRSLRGVALMMRLRAALAAGTALAPEAGPA
jgi:iron complex transport system substrate-binding protein